MTAKQYLQLYKKYENRYFILAEQIKALERVAQSGWRNASSPW